MYSQSLFRKLITLFFFFFSAISFVSAQSGKSSEENQDLYNEIAHMDSVLFNAYNTQDLEKIKTLFTEDLEFYHDKGGLTHYSENVEAFKKLFSENRGLKRDLVKGSMEVFPIKGYGAVETGSHSFCHMENGKPDCGTFKFLHIWKKENGAWKIARVVSYDH